MKRKVLWAGRFQKEADQSTLSFTSSLSVDSRLAFYDIVGSIAHVMMLSEQNIIGKEDGDEIVEGLLAILRQMEGGQLDFSQDLEDIHSAIELTLTDMIGAAGGKMHTARSRNDQVATDLRMLIRDSILEAIEGLIDLERALKEKAEIHLESVMPGFTHMQHAQPVTIGFHLMSHCFKLGRDVDRFMDAYSRVNRCPLGSAALAGTTYDIDREYTADLLAFDCPTDNAMDSVSDRDVVVEFLSNAALTMVHLSSICEELIVWNSPEFDFVEIDDQFTTGSSIMPQKKNPDVAELIRGRSGGTIGDLTSMLATMKGLPMAYNRDLQEDKEYLFRSMDTLLPSLEIFASMVATLEFNEGRMEAAAEQGFLNATDLADYLVSKGIPFREAHAIVGEIVRYASSHHKKIGELSVEELKDFCEEIDASALEMLSIEGCVHRRTSKGGTSPEEVTKQIEKVGSMIEEHLDFVHREEEKIEDALTRLLNG